MPEPLSSAEYYRSHPAARRKKQRKDKVINSRPDQIKKRVESNRARRRAKARGQNVTGRDYDHATDSFVKIKTNRGRRGEGGRRKKRA